MWLLYAQFEIRQKNLQGARKTMVWLSTNTYYIFIEIKIRLHVILIRLNTRSCLLVSPVREQRSVNVQRTNCWRAISSWSCSCVSSIAAGSCMRSTWSSARRTAPPGSSSLSWRPSWGTRTEHAPSLSSPPDSHDWTCQRCSLESYN